MLECLQPFCFFSRTPVHPARQKILEYLKRHGQATIDELADHLDMAPVSVRHHLDLLIGDDLVEASRVRRHQGAGRPKRLYALTPQADDLFPHNYRKLAHSSLDLLKQVLSPEDLAQAMEALAQDSLQRAPQDLAQQPLEERIQAVVDFLNQEGYMAFVETEGEQLILHTCHCPYKDLIQDHPEICHMDSILLKRLTGMKLVYVNRIREGATRCSYRLVPLEEPHSLPLTSIPS